MVKKNGLVFIRSKKTGNIDIRRANEFTKRPSASSPSQERALHYIGSDRSRVCRCSNQKRHHEKLHSVASESLRLNASLTLYLDRHDLQSCTLEDFKRWQQRLKVLWAKDGVYTERFHYASKEKTIVCRCSKASAHSYGVPRNPKIIEQCAEFFRMYNDSVSCNKNQWQAVDADLPPAYSPESLVDPFTYDSRSTVELLQNRATQDENMSVSQEMKIRSTAERVAPVDMTHLRGGPRGEPDIPEKVWKHARPSVWIPRHGSDTLASTPLGTAVTPVNPRAAAAPGPRPYSNAHSKLSQRPSTATYWSDIQRDASVSEDKEFPEPPRVEAMTSSPPLVDEKGTKYPTAYEKGQDVPSPEFSRLSISMSVPFLYDDSRLEGKPVAELPAQRAAAEPRTKPIYRHTATLRELEGSYSGNTSDLAGKQSNAHEGKAPSRAPILIKPYIRLSSLFEQVHDIVRLPDQEEFLLRHAIISSRANPAPMGDCTVCSEPYQNGHTRTLMLPGCGHCLHEPCLLAEFRTRDQQIGTCPICDLALCERTLADRIDTDREAIFGRQSTQLRYKVRIEFQQHSEVVECGSEEEVAASQLRLVKTYVDVHAAELFCVWEANRAEPDWYACVVRPVTRLFQGWNVSVRQSRYFVDREAFVKLVAWAELVRLMNTARAVAKKTQGEDAPYPQLAELHRKFMWAKNRYDKEKKTWQTNRSGMLDCEKVAQDAIELAMSTHLP